MSSYNGPATVTVGTDTFTVEATLCVNSSQYLISWRGTLDFEASDDLWVVTRAREALITLPDGKGGTVIPTHFKLGDTRMDVSGSGPAPF
jgi:hypothetical protein